MIPVLHGVWAAAGGLVGDFEHIETQTVGAGGAASITFSSIPGTYKHLQIRSITRGTATSNTTYLALQFNSDTAANYSTHYVYGDGSSALSGSAVSQTRIDFGNTTAANAAANIFGAGVMDILDYASTTKNKTTRWLGGEDRNGSGLVLLYSGNWRSTAAITSITLTAASSTVAQYSTFSLYGVK